jgi:hypothetical protein
MAMNMELSMGYFQINTSPCSAAYGLPDKEDYYNTENYLRTRIVRISEMTPAGNINKQEE